MHHQFLVAFALFGGLNALPLNINLGAYSPALVVGDGEISFGGNQDVSNLMNALEGAAVSGAAANGQAGAAAAAAPAAQPVAAQPAAAVVPGQGQDVTQITSLQGMGKEIAPRVVKLVPNPASVKRDIAGFNAALNYATGALKTSPEVQLGTGEGGSGVGITQKPGTAAAAAPATATKATVKAHQVLERDADKITSELVARDQAIAKEAAARAVARDDTAAPKMKTTVTTMFVRGGPAPAARSEDGTLVEKRETTSTEKRAPSPGLDGVNLNMAEGQVAELTFVETRAVNDDE
ncbi:hypothetical protein V8E51_009418 [Hyaloscypha variabilis]